LSVLQQSWYDDHAFALLFFCVIVHFWHARVKFSPQLSMELMLRQEWLTWVSSRWPLLSAASSLLLVVTLAVVGSKDHKHVVAFFCAAVELLVLAFADKLMSYSLFWHSFGHRLCTGAYQRSDTKQSECPLHLMAFMTGCPHWQTWSCPEFAHYHQLVCAL